MASSSADVVDRLAQLQSLIKRDPDAYAEEFGLQLRNFEAELEIFRMQPSADAKRFRELLVFLSHVAQCYPKRMADFPQQLMDLIRQHYSVLRADLRRTLVQSITLMRNRGMVEAVPMLKLFFELFRCQDKSLRELLFGFIVSDIKNQNVRRRNVKMNKTIQNFMYAMLKDENDTAARKSLDVMVALYRKRIWTDARTVNVLATACLSNKPKILVPALRFFLGVVMEDEEESDDEEERLKQKAPSRHSRHTKKRLRKAEVVMGKIKKVKNKEAKVHDMFPAIQLLHDPQGLAEKLLRQLKAAKQRFEVRLIMMNVISRIIGQHKLLVLDFYSFVQRYMTAYQQNVTQIMAYLAQACHELVPPNELVPVVRAIANNFVVDRVPPEAIQVGLNGLREVLTRTPLVLEEDGMGNLIQDLVLYRKYRNKGVSVAARSLLNAVRELHPSLLRRRDRGKEHDPSARPNNYGNLRSATAVDGLELLIQDEAARMAAGEDEEDDDAWDMHKHGNDSGSDSDDWIDLEEELGPEVSDDDEGGEDDSDNDSGAGAGAGAGASAVDDATLAAARKKVMARVLTPRDFARIAELRAGAGGTKRPRPDDSESGAVTMDAAVVEVDVEDLEGSAARKRRRALERLEEAKVEQLQWQLKQRRGGTTNSEKKRKKNFLMLRKSTTVQAKVKRSLKDQAASIRKHRNAKEKMGKRLKRRRR